MIKPISIPMDDKFVQDAAYYAFKTVTCSFENGMKSRFGNGGLFKHMLGKLGERHFTASACRMASLSSTRHSAATTQS